MKDKLGLPDAAVEKAAYIYRKAQEEIQRLKGIVLYNWNKDTKKKTVDALASYRKNALPALRDIASLVWDKEIQEYVLDKMKQINESNI